MINSNITIGTIMYIYNKRNVGGYYLKITHLNRTHFKADYGDYRFYAHNITQLNSMRGYIVQWYQIPLYWLFKLKEWLKC